MTKAIGKMYLSDDVNRTNSPYLEIIRSGGGVHVNAYSNKHGSIEYINFQMHDAVFKKWAEAFTLMASEL